MKILLITPNLKQVGGVSNYYKVLKLSDLDYIDYFEVGASSTSKDNILSKTVRLIRGYIKFSYLIIFKKYDIVHLNPSLDSKSFFRDFIFILISKVFRKKIIVFFRGWDPAFFSAIRDNFILAMILKKFYLKSNLIITLGEYFKKLLIDFDSDCNHNIEILSTVADNIFLPEKNNISDIDKGISFLYMSRLVKSKGVYRCIEIFNEIKKIHKNCILNICGDGEELENLIDFLKTKKIEGVNYLGQVTGREKYDIINRSDVLLFLSEHGEGLPNTILESLLYGLIIISSDKGAINDWISDDNGFIYSNYEKDKILDYLFDLFSDSRKLNKISYNNSKYAKSSFTPEVVSRKLLNIYEKVYNSK